jgi:hypothetical protein
MSKLPFMQFYPDLWLRDTRCLSHIAKSVWVDVVAYAWNEPARGVYERTFSAFCLEHRLESADANRVLAELRNVADVRFGEDQVRIECRRQVREERARQLNAKYQAVYRDKHKSKDQVSTPLGRNNPEKLEVRSHKDLNTSSAEPSNGEASPPTVPTELVAHELYAADPKLCAALPLNIKAWKTTYPGVDIPGEIAKAHAWELANPQLRKVNRIRFLNNWLARAQDRLRRTDPNGNGNYRNGHTEPKEQLQWH